jgi:predicted transcriptional regulator
VTVPAEAKLDAITRLRLLVEMGARGGMAKVDWRQQTRGFNYPQTEEDRQFPTNVVVELNNLVIGQIYIADDPADARGVLSHHSGIDPGSYGYLTELVIEGDALETLKRELTQTPVLRLRFAVPGDAQHAGGLSLYGETVGCYPLGPTLILEM